MSHSIKVCRMFTGVESCTVDVDYETLSRIRRKSISRSELNELFNDAYVDLDPVVNEYPHTVHIISTTGGHPTVIDYEEEPDV